LQFLRDATEPITGADAKSRAAQFNRYLKKMIVKKGDNYTRLQHDSVYTISNKDQLFDLIAQTYNLGIKIVKSVQLLNNLIAILAVLILRNF